MKTIVITAEIEFRFALLKSTWFHYAAVEFPRTRHRSKRRRRWVGVNGSTSNGRHDPKCPSAKRLRMVLEDTGAPNDCLTRSWLAADEAVGFTCKFLAKWRSSQRLICRRHPESGLRVNDISRFYWSHHLLTAQPERPK
ncbi:uncharacterized protein TNCV_2259431 [Trichonephila clavipes]|nr:uncharacterized protein TNCV_2259431 [Trichonephila clavipes]